MIVDESRSMETDTSTELTAADRCDSCGAQAYVRAVSVDTGLDLLFCSHHWRTQVESSPKFIAGAWRIRDERMKLEASLA